MMSKFYKVWLEIERIDEDLDIYEDAHEPRGLAVFNSLDEAKEYVETLAESTRNVV
jgi:hypothetical protein